MNISIPLNNTVQIINVERVNPLISKCQIKVCWVSDTEVNRNGSLINHNAALGIANTLPGCPIVGFYNPVDKDFEGHNREIQINEKGEIVSKDTTIPYGFVDLNAKVWYQMFLDADGVEREYLCTEGWLWTTAYPESRRILEKGNNQSMELNEKNSQIFWTDGEKGQPGFFIINQTMIEKLCILGENVEPCFEGANITSPSINFSLDEDLKTKMFELIANMQKSIEGGTEMSEQTVTVEEGLEAPVSTEEFSASSEEVTTSTEDTSVNTEEFAKKDEEEEKEEEKTSENSEDKTGEESENKNEEDEKKKKYSLEEIPEYVSLQNEFAQLQADFAALKEAKESLDTLLNELKEFKANIEKEEKIEMINRFSILPEEDTKEFRENLDKYSLDEIESKLSVICVRKKVNFNLEDETSSKEEESSLTFSVNNESIDGSLAPSWIKRVKEVEKEMNN